MMIVRREFAFSEWEAGSRPTNSFEDGQYRSTWGVRRFATDTEMWHYRLDRIKPEYTRSELIEAFTGMADAFIHHPADASENDGGRLSDSEREPMRH
jgi:hypothetical protein